MNIKETNTSVPAAERLQEISKDLDRVIIDIEKNNRKLKELEKSKESLRSHFFSLVDEYIGISGTTETQVVNVKCASRAEATEYIQENYPGWILVQYEPDQIVIEEDPSQMKFSWTTEDGYQINRTTAVVGTKFDFDKLMWFDEELFNEIVESKVVYELNEKKAQEMIEQRPELLPVLQESTKLGKIQLRMSSPKKVNDDE
jgi:hypothetical protein